MADFIETKNSQTGMMSNKSFLSIVIFLSLFLTCCLFYPLQVKASVNTIVQKQDDKKNYKGTGMSKKEFVEMMKTTLGYRTTKYASQSMAGATFVPLHELIRYSLHYDENPSYSSRAAYYYYVGETEKCTELAREILEQSSTDFFDKAEICGFAIAGLNKDMNLFKWKQDESTWTDEISNWCAYVTTYFPDVLKKVNIDSSTSYSYAEEFLELINLVRTTCSFLMNTLNEKGEKELAELDKEMLQLSHDKLFPYIDQWKCSPTLRLGILGNELALLNAKGKLDSIEPSFLEKFWNTVADTTEPSEYDSYTSILSRNARLSCVKTAARILAYRCIKYEDTKYWYDSLNFLLRARNYELWVNGAQEYKDFANVTWQSIAQTLDDGEYAIEFFETAIADDDPYLDASMRMRNNAFVISKNNITYLYRESRDRTESTGIYFMNELQPDYVKAYVTSTPSMSMLDIASLDLKTVRLHTLSDITKVKARQRTNLNNILFVGDLKYSKNGENGTAHERILSNKAKMGQLSGAKTEADSIQSLFPNVKLLTGLNATPENFKSEIQNANIVHISTHGIFDEAMVSELNEEYPLGGLLGDNVLKSCRLALSGYNDDPEQCFKASSLDMIDLSNVDLVFLDACESAAGQEISDQVYSMAEALHRAGAKCVIANLDPIPDELATDFALEFYSDLKMGFSYHKAFFMAKFEFAEEYILNQSKSTHEELVNNLNEARSLRIILWE